MVYSLDALGSSGGQGCTKVLAILDSGASHHVMQVELFEGLRKRGLPAWRRWTRRPRERSPRQ